MPKPSGVMDVNTGLFTFALLNDHQSDINNPKLWIEESNVTGMLTWFSKDQANGELISEIHESIYGKPYGKKEAKSKIQSIAAKMKADKNLPKKVWAIAYYRHKRLYGTITKAEIAKQIRSLLVKSFPKDVPVGSGARAGQIPNEKTIATRWLKELVTKK